MADYLSQSFDFGVRIVQLARWLKDEGKEFPLVGRLLECGTGLGVSLRVAKSLNDKDCRVQAFRQAEEAQYMLELMVKTDFITELQSGPLLSECKSIKNEIIDSKSPNYCPEDEIELNPQSNTEKQGRKKRQKRSEWA